jgi:hypothetical protein
MKTAVEQFWKGLKLTMTEGDMLHAIPHFEKAKEMEKEQMVNFALFRDDYLEKANTLEDFTIPNEDLVKLFKQQEQ